VRTYSNRLSVFFLSISPTQISEDKLYNSTLQYIDFYEQFNIQQYVHFVLLSLIQKRFGWVEALPSQDNKTLSREWHLISVDKDYCLHVNLLRSCITAQNVKVIQAE
jgi:hypothetical protein